MNWCVYCGVELGKETTIHACPTLAEWSLQKWSGEVAMRNAEAEYRAAFGLPLLVDESLPDNVILFRRRR